MEKYLRPVIIISVIGGSIPFFLIAFPVQSPTEIQNNSARYKAFGLLRWEDGKDHPLPQDFADMIGWKELAEKIDTVCTHLPNFDQTLILCDSYGEAGAINFYTSNKNLRAVSFNADYINWFNLDKKIVNVILVKEPGNDIDNETIIQKEFFDTTYIAGSITSEFARENGATIYVLKGAKTDFNRRLMDEIDRKKNYR